jgi:hypothetical protein
VTPVGPAPVNYNPVSNVKPVTKTSLAAKRQDVPPVSGHNYAPKPYGGPQVSSVNGDGVNLTAVELISFVQRQLVSECGV